MTTEEKIAVLEAAKSKLEDCMLARAEKINALTGAWDFSPGEINKTWADWGSLDDLICVLRDYYQERIDKDFDRAVSAAGGVQ